VEELERLLTRYREARTVLKSARSTATSVQLAEEYEAAREVAEFVSHLAEVAECATLGEA
jgi:hypothetical protein